MAFERKVAALDSLVPRERDGAEPGAQVPQRCLLSCSLSYSESPATVLGVQEHGRLEQGLVEDATLEPLKGAKADTVIFGLGTNSRLNEVIVDQE